ncbi:hypothetical protein J2W56_002008 [Nocardia kruczakiae]|uniref:Uncharacterized protein n=1 Tax=Nocardia kruczakiae TaxID=261477 RepID=A0ABU1XCL2_9NOCA|nr:hypothetical protein [Nocardia kruczakiae]
MFHIANQYAYVIKTRELPVSSDSRIP